MYLCGMLEYIHSSHHKFNHKSKDLTSFDCGGKRETLEFKVPALETVAAGAGCAGTHVNLARAGGEIRTLNRESRDVSSDACGGKSYSLAAFQATREVGLGEGGKISVLPRRSM
jgi:hypothetical protein